MAMSPFAVIAIVLACAGAAVMIGVALTHSYMRARNAKTLNATEQVRDNSQRGYMTDVRERNVRDMMLEYGWQDYAPPKRPHMNMRTDTDDSMGTSR